MQAPVRDGRSSTPILESAEILVALLIMGLGWLVWYVARERYYLSDSKLLSLLFTLVLRLLLSSALLSLLLPADRAKNVNGRIPLWSFHESGTSS